MSIQTPKKGFFGRALDLFGPGTPLTNEPTIDYNDTIHSYKHDGFSVHNRKYGTIQDDDDSDVELNSDLNRIYEQINENSTKLSSRYSLPDDFPGKFQDRSSFEPDRFINSDDVFLNSAQESLHKPGPLPRFGSKSHGIGDDAPSRYSTRFSREPFEASTHVPYFDPVYRSDSYIRKPRLNIGIHRSDTSYTRPYSAYSPSKEYGLGNSDEPFLAKRGNLRDDLSHRYLSRSSPRNIDIYNDSIDDELKKLENEVDMESITKLNTKFNQFDINRQPLNQVSEMLDAIQRNNKTLSQLDELIDMTNETDENLPTKYEKLKQEMRRELLTHQDFYKSYIALVNKYRALKKAPPSLVQNDRLIARINLIKTSTKENSVKLICNNLLNDLKSNVGEIEGLKAELEALKNKIRELQNRL